jgi:hypothetical protein
MAIGGPPVAPSVRSWLGLARELTMGTAVSPTNTLPVDMKSYAPEDMPKFLPDEALRGSMAGLYNEIIGPADASFSFGGPNFLDIHGFMLDNLFGDLSTTGSNAANPTSLGGSVASLSIGGTQCTVVSATGYAAGSAVQIDSGSISEVVTLAAVAGTLLTFNYPLRFAHNSGATVSTVNSPFTHKFALLNSQLGYGGVAGAQPPTHTLTDNTNLNYSGTPGTNTSGARAYPGAAVSSIDFSGNSENLLEIKFAGNSNLSQPASATPSNVISSVVPVANWRAQIYIGGTSAGNQVTDIGEWSLSLKRQLQVYWTVQDVQSPFIIARGPMTAEFSMKFTTPPDETPLSYLLYQGYQYVHIALSSPGSGGTVVSLTVDAHSCQTTKSKPGRSAVLMDFDNTWEAIANSTDVGGSGGLGPVTVQLQNAIAQY